MTRIALALAPVVLAASGCVTTVSVELPKQRFLTPEARGELGDGSVSVTYGSTARVVLAEGVGRATPTMDAPRIESADSFGLTLDVGLLERIDFLLSGDLGLGAKIQIVGDPAARAGAGNTSVAVAGSVGRTRESGSSETTYDLTGRKIKVATEAEARHIDLALLGGYRPHPRQVVYASLGRMGFVAEGDFERTIDGQPSERYSAADGKGAVSNALVGWRYEPAGFLLQLETGVASVRFDRAAPSTGAVFGGVIGVRW